MKIGVLSDTHDNLLPGSTVTPDDLSAYVDSQGMISRFRLKYESPEKVTGDLVLGSRAERGYTLTLARKRQPLVCELMRDDALLEAHGLERPEFTW